MSDTSRIVVGWIAIGVGILTLGAAFVCGIGWILMHALAVFGVAPHLTRRESGLNPTEAT